MNHLDIASRILRNNKTYAKTFKCQFHKTHVEYLAHLMSGEGISVDPKKIEAIYNWESRNNVKQVQSCLGFVTITKHLSNILEI